MRDGGLDVVAVLAFLRFPRQRLHLQLAGVQEHTPRGNPRKSGMRLSAATL